MASEVSSLTNKPGKDAQSWCAMSGSIFLLNHREWNTLFQETAERIGKLIGFASSHGRYGQHIFGSTGNALSTAGRTVFSPKKTPDQISNQEQLSRDYRCICPQA